jgi:hypothetical protein
MPSGLAHKPVFPIIYPAINRLWCIFRDDSAFLVSIFGIMGAREKFSLLISLQQTRVLTANQISVCITMSDLGNPHDRFFKEAFSRPEVARDFLAYQERGDWPSI